MLLYMAELYNTKKLGQSFDPHIKIQNYMVKRPSSGDFRTLTCNLSIRGPKKKKVVIPSIESCSKTQVPCECWLKLPLRVTANLCMAPLGRVLDRWRENLRETIRFYYYGSPNVHSFYDGMGLQNSGGSAIARENPLWLVYIAMLG